MKLEIESDPKHGSFQRENDLKGLRFDKHIIKTYYTKCIWLVGSQSSFVFRYIEWSCLVADSSFDLKKTFSTMMIKR